MKKMILFFLLMPMIVFSLPSAQIVTTITWTTPTTNMDGSPLTNLDGYKIYCRQSTAEPYIDANSITISALVNAYQISDLSLPEGMNYCVIATLAGVAESLFSNEVNFTIQAGLAQVGEGVPLNTVPAAPGISVQ